MPFVYDTKDDAVEPYFNLNIHLAQFVFSEKKKNSVMFIEIGDGQKRLTLSLDEVGHLKKLCEQMQDLFDVDGPNEKGRAQFSEKGK